MPGFAKTLAGGDRRSIGNSNRVAAVVLRQPDRLAEVIECLRSPDPVVRMRAADAAEKVSAKRPELLGPFKMDLLSLAAESTQAELRWHLALMIPRLRLTLAERHHAVRLFSEYLSDRSSIVKTFAIQALADLSRGVPDMHTDLVDLLERTARDGTAAMKARSRILLKALKQNPA